MKIFLIPPADNELDDAANYYNKQLTGLGGDFYKEFIRKIEIITLFPEAWMSLEHFLRGIFVAVCHTPKLVSKLIITQTMLLKARKY